MPMVGPMPKIIDVKRKSFILLGGSAPEPPEFTAFWATSCIGKKRAGDRSPGPSRLAAWVSARVALQRSPVLCPGKRQCTVL